MRIAIMQPYFLPYIGYFQLIGAVDLWVNMDHASFMKHSYMTRNEVKGPTHMTLPLLGASQNLNSREIQVDYQNKLLKKLLVTLKHLYGKAPYFEPVMELLETHISEKHPSLAGFNFALIEKVNGYIGLNTQLRHTSIGLTELKKSDGIIDIVKQLGGTTYINPIMGQSLYQKDVFESHGLGLNFLKMNPLGFENDYLSILHFMMELAPEEINGLMNEYTLI